MTAPRVRFICLGDSLTLGIANSDLHRWPVRLAIELEHEWPGEYEVYTRAYNGATTFDALGKIEGEVGYLFPGILLVVLGVNDALVRQNRKNPLVGLEDFRRNLTEIHRFATSKGAKTVFVIEHVPSADLRPKAQRFYVPGNGQTYRDNYEPYRQAILALGKELRSFVIDLPAMLEKEGKTSSALVMPDGLHLTDDGNAIYANLIFEGLRGHLPKLVAAIDRVPAQCT